MTDHGLTDYCPLITELMHGGYFSFANFGYWLLAIGYWIGAAAMKIVVAYSGGLHTSVILKLIKEAYSAAVLAFCAHIAQAEELEGWAANPLRTPASQS